MKKYGYKQIFMNKQMQRKVALILTFALLGIISANTVACSALKPQVKAEDLMKDVKRNQKQGKTIDREFVNNVVGFTWDLFKKSAEESKNTLISPISVMLALSMTANGADGATLSQMERVLAKDIPLDTLNEYLYRYTTDLPSGAKSKLKIANSIWFRDDENRLITEKDFLQKNADYYHAEIFKSPFTQKTLLDINNWVKINTDGMIDKIIDEIDYDTIMYLINAIVFDAEWKVVYNKGNVYQSNFIAINGKKQNVDFMRSEEHSYLDDGNATGFIKPYYNDEYSLVALLPNAGVDISSYIANLTGEGLLNTINNAEKAVVNSSIPKFSYEYEIELNDILKSLGMPDSFDPVNADFSRLGRSSRGNIYIGDVLHKTYISLDELGTKAGAVTKVEMKDESAPLNIKTVTLDRPFVYLIIDKSTKIPVFIGTILDLEE